MTDLPGFDVVIAGGGPVACAVAAALAGSRLSAVQLAGDRRAADRPIALSYGSRLILERLGAWRHVQSTPIEAIHVSQQHAFGRTVMQAREHGFAALGYVTAYSDVLARLAERADSATGRLLDWSAGDDHVEVRALRGGEEVSMRARLLVLADGDTGPSPERVRDYLQRAVVAEVVADRAHRGIAWERFTPEGPVALLPFRDGYALVWSAREATAQELLGLSDPEFLERLRRCFGGRAGNFVSAGPRAAFPLSLRRGAATPAPRTLAVGNAAQTLHPVAGQGLNLGLRDAWELAQMLLEVPPQEIGTSRFVDRYVRKRRFDRYAGIGFTDFLVRVFSNPLPLAAARGAGLAMLDTLPPARRFLARRMIFGARALP